MVHWFDTRRRKLDVLCICLELFSIICNRIFKPTVSLGFLQCRHVGSSSDQQRLHVHHPRCCSALSGTWKDTRLTAYLEELMMNTYDATYDGKLCPAAECVYSSNMCWIEEQIPSLVSLIFHGTLHWLPIVIMPGLHLTITCFQSTSRSSMYPHPMSIGKNSIWVIYLLSGHSFL